ncbi:hypothetical protein KN63_02740 [Smithella sp. F21]|nr:hypothetical protein KN63_02740 [Smithella sp. F21]HBJ75931.1 hypothetical protein [Syntrophaceae bacterium]
MGCLVTHVFNQGNVPSFLNYTPANPGEIAGFHIIINDVISSIIMRGLPYLIFFLTAVII